MSSPDLTAAAHLIVNQLQTGYDRHTIIENLSLTLKVGEIGCLLGPSGCGKTTLLRSIAGFQPITQGRVKLDNTTLSTKQQHIAVEHRHIGMVFQDFALFPHLTLADNIGFGIQHLSSSQRLERINQLMSLVGLTGMNTRYPHELSGGQQQRIALARALAPKPKLLLLDEPFSSLDVELRESLAKEVRAILKHEGITALMVTHNQNEAFAIADKVGVVHKGNLLQWDSPYRLYHEPIHPFVAKFIGNGVLLPGTLLKNGAIKTELGEFKGAFTCEQLSVLQPGSRVQFLVRPDDIIHDDDSQRVAIVESRDFRGSHFLFTLLLPSGATVLCMSQSHHDHPVGEAIGIRLEMDHGVVFPFDTQLD